MNFKFILKFPHLGLHSLQQTHKKKQINDKRLTKYEHFGRYQTLVHQLVLMKCLFWFEGLKSLCVLSLDQTKVTDAGMVQYLQSAPSCLSQLSLNQTEVTEATLAALPTCVPQLRLLSIKQTKALQLISTKHCLS